VKSRFFEVLAPLILMLPVQLAAQEGGPKHHHYKVIDVRFGGPGGGISNPASPSLNSQGTLVGVADTPAPDPFAPDCFTDCYVALGFKVQDGIVIPMYPPPSGSGLSSFADAVNDSGLIAGQAQNGAIDSSTGWPESHAVLWENGQTIAKDLGTLGGTQSVANSINDWGQIIGAALTATPDPYANSPLNACLLCAPASFALSTIFFPGTTETHAFVWQNGVMRDLHTLGGPDSNAWISNEQGEVAGWSFTSFVANPATGVPTVDPFFWSPEDQKMVDLGGFGGTYGYVYWINNRGQIAGASNLPGDDTEHPFIWSKSQGMVDLFLGGGLGGTFGHPDSLNDAGEVVGFALTTGDQVGHGFLWRNGVMTDLGTVGTDLDSEGSSINSQGQIAGTSFTFGVGDLHGFLWENGGPIVDLNTLIVAGTSMTVTAGLLINDRGEIGCLGKDPVDTVEHACELIPCDENHPGIEGCDYTFVETVTSAGVHPAQPAQTDPSAATAGKVSLAESIARYRQFLANRHRIFAGTAAH
jgi:probable HAF family extracellular repeat protein